MSQDEFARAVFLALLARDPLPAQRFTEIQTRMQHLAALSYAVAQDFEAIIERWRKDPVKAQAQSAHEFDFLAPQTPPPKEQRRREAQAMPHLEGEPPMVQPALLDLLSQAHRRD